MMVRSLVLAFLAGFSLSFSAPWAWSGPTLDRLFKHSKPIIAALYLDLPDDFRDPRALAELIRWGKLQQDLLVEEGVDGILWEYQAGDILEPKLSPAQVDAMGEVLAHLSEDTELVVGVEVLWHYPEETLKVAKLGGAQFVRLDFFSDEMEADGKVVPIDPLGVLNYRRKIGAENIALLTDIQVKYATMLNPLISLIESARQALALGSEGVIVSGVQSGKAPSSNRVRQARWGAGASDVIVGSGFDKKNASSLLRYASGAIVGTSISEKTGGPLVRHKVRDLMSVVRRIRMETQ